MTSQPQLSRIRTEHPVEPLNLPIGGDSCHSDPLGDCSLVIQTQSPAAGICQAAPGVLAQNTVARLASRFVQIRPKVVHQTPLSPKSEALVKQSKYPEQALRKLFEEIDLSPTHWSLDPEKDSDRKQFDYLGKIKKEWMRNPDVGVVHNKLANHQSLLRTYSSEILIAAGRAELERLDFAALTDPERVDDLTLITDVLFNLSADAGIKPDNLSSYLTGRDTDGWPSGRNFLVTVLAVDGEPRYRFLSVSGDLEPPLENGKVVFDVMGNNTDSSRLRATVLKPSMQLNACTVQTNLRKLVNQSKTEVIYVGYRDLLVGSHAKKAEARMVPRTLTPHRGGYLDRAQDTEYTALNTLMMILAANPEMCRKKLDITMYSKLPMCHACQNAATFAMLDPVLSGLKSFKVYAGSRRN